jgi:hypothetical protein
MFHLSLVIKNESSSYILCNIFCDNMLALHLGSESQRRKSLQQTPLNLASLVLALSLVFFVKYFIWLIFARFS